MKGLELSKSYFENFGRAMLEGFPEIMPKIAVGLCGSGSECFGFDDEISKDHDFEPGFCIFLPSEDVVDRRSAFMLERAYSKLPSEFSGVERLKIQPVGGSRHGVIRIEDFFRDKTGFADGQLSCTQWISLPDYALAEATNGEIFFDNLGLITKIRRSLDHYPEDIRKKKLAGNLLVMAQSGQYNYRRCLDHGEAAAAQLAVDEFVRAAMAAGFLLNRRYQPYYKWGFRAMRQLKKLPYLPDLLEYLLCADNSDENSEEKLSVIESVSADIIDELSDQGLTKAICQDLEKHAYSVNDAIEDPGIRNLHVLAAV
ncbi:MAG: DUF4037 domain-containing protein [Clostridia bacterium]|nr:DUF4037 domain-containing protein [Clostridia bacterium]